ncbi:cellulose 1,4-beta-cellobiosidase [Streptacidiphilus sp. ASG 303]|uniref:PA14 domain-containing protein n=1 Tax=Streptacidiphilus sp. ASG 303 TaxID=2896847 RepID=UPI001E2D7547|nr:PA14 domain-containing protein [Streptacidiphilus sp. ASG 303]MCD0484008.1 cellulose 1,4-beta-cellobiosidase [Streptacidiphilus sp. ASG 303]
MHQKRSVAVLTGGALSAVALGGLLAAAAPQAAAAAACSANVYQRTFYKNTAFSGSAVRTDCDDVISQSWSGSPATGVPSDNFGVRWSVTRDFGSGGPFTFTASATDGVRVYLDGVRRIDLWTGTGDTARSKGVNLTVPSGRHTLRVDYVNWSGAAKVAFTYTPRTSAAYDSTKPLAPTGVRTAYDTRTRRTTVSWSANKEMDLAGYSLHRRPVGSGTWTTVATTAARSYTDPLVNPDDRTPYSYEVRARDKAGNTSSGSVDTIVRPLPVVTSLTGTYDRATGKVALTWPLNTEPHFDHYTVLSNDKVDGSYRWVPLGTTRGSTWTAGPVAADGETRHYRVLVTNDGGTTTYNPDWLDATAANELWLGIPDGIAPARAPELSLGSCTGGIRATATDDTPSPIRDFAGFEIERREAGTDTRSVVLHKAYDPRLDPATVTVCDPLPADGRTYEYRARTYDAAGNYSPYSEIRASTAG